MFMREKKKKSSLGTVARERALRTIEQTDIRLFGRGLNARVGSLRYKTCARGDPTLRYSVDAASYFLTSK